MTPGSEKNTSYCFVSGLITFVKDYLLNFKFSLFVLLNLNPIFSMFITASWFPELKNYLGLRGVSPVWRDKPAYYFWIDGSPCVFSLELGHAESEMGLVEEFIYCDFLVRAFPFRNTDLYSGFSEHEKRALSGPIFDGSNTPCFERLEDLNKNFFIVSRIDWLYGKSGSWGLFSLNALDLHVTRRDDCRAILRKVPSWQISLPLFDILNSLYASLFQAKTPKSTISFQIWFGIRGNFCR